MGTSPSSRSAAFLARLVVRTSLKWFKRHELRRASCFPQAVILLASDTWKCPPRQVGLGMDFDASKNAGLAHSGPEKEYNPGVGNSTEERIAVTWYKWISSSLSAS